MDQKQAPESVVAYARFIRKTTPNIRKIYLFGSYARGTHHQNSDMDLAVIFDSLHDSFDMQVELMKKRRQFDNRIEPHPFTSSDFNSSHPLARDIIQNGLEIL